MGRPITKYDLGILAAAFVLFVVWLVTRIPALRVLILLTALAYFLRRLWVGYRNFGK